MSKDKKVLIKHKELISFISETIMELYAQRIIKEQQSTYIKVIPTNQPVKSYAGTKQEAEKAWNNLDSDIKNTLTQFDITPFSLIPQSSYAELPYNVQQYIQGYLYPYNPGNQFFSNYSLATGQAIYQYIPGIRTIMLKGVEVCVNRKTGKKVDCETGLALDGTYQESGFEIDDAQIVIPSLFAFEGEAKMNTKYFCRPYLVGDKPIPENVKPKVLMYLQKAYSKTTGKDLGVNKNNWYTGDKQTNKELSQKLESATNQELLKLVSDYIKKSTNEKENAYKSGQWSYMVGDRKNKEESYPLSPEQHTRYFKNMYDFAEMLLRTDCGFGVGEKGLTNEEREIRKKFGDVFAFISERPDNWDDMSEEDQEKWLKENESKIEREGMTTEEQDEVQFWWDMFSLALAVVGTILVATGVGAPIGAGLIYASIGTGVASGIFDLYQGQTGWGVLAIGLEVVPFLKVLKVSKAIKVAGISDKKIAKMLEYGLKNGQTRMLKKFPKKGPALYKALKENGEEMLKLLDQSTKESIDFLKRFSTLDAVEFYSLKRMNPAFADAIGGMTYKEFSTQIDEIASMMFANRNAWRTFLGKAKYSLGVPAKIVAANLVGFGIMSTADCFVVMLNINGKNIMLDALSIKDGTAPITGLKTIKINLDPDAVKESGLCTAFALIAKNLIGNNPDEIKEIETILNQEIPGDVKIKKEGGNTVITVENLNEGKDVTVLDVEETVETIVDVLNVDLDGLYRATIESYTDDEEILEYWLFQLGDGELEKGEKALDDLLKGVNKGDMDDLDTLFDLIYDSDKVFIKKKEDIDNRRKQKELEYAI